MPHILTFLGFMMVLTSLLLAAGTIPALGLGGAFIILYRAMMCFGED